MSKTTKRARFDEEKLKDSKRKFEHREDRRNIKRLISEILEDPEDEVWEDLDLPDKEKI